MLGSLTSGGFALVLRLTLNRLLGRFLGRRLERVEVRGDAIELRDVALDAAALGNAVAPPGCVVESCTVDRLVRAPASPARARRATERRPRRSSAPSVRHLRRDGCVLRLEGVRVVAAPRVAPRPNAVSRLETRRARAAAAAAAADARRVVARATRAVGAWAEGVAERTSVVVAGAAVVFDDFGVASVEATGDWSCAGGDLAGDVADPAALRDVFETYAPRRRQRRRARGAPPATRGDARFRRVELAWRGRRASAAAVAVAVASRPAGRRWGAEAAECAVHDGVDRIARLVGGPGRPVVVEGAVGAPPPRWRGPPPPARRPAARRPDAPTVYAVRVDEVAASVRAAPGAAVAALDVAGVDVATDAAAAFRSRTDAGRRRLSAPAQAAAAGGNLGEAVRVPDARREVAVVDEPLVVGEAAARGDGDGPRRDPGAARAADAVAATLAALRRVAAALPGGPRRRRRRRTAPSRATTPPTTPTTVSASGERRRGEDLSLWARLATLDRCELRGARDAGGRVAVDVAGGTLRAYACSDGLQALLDLAAACGAEFAAGGEDEDDGDDSSAGSLGGQLIGGDDDDDDDDASSSTSSDGRRRDLFMSAMGESRMFMSALGESQIAGDPVELGDLAGASRRALEASVEYGSEDAASELSDGGSSDGDGDDADDGAVVVVRGAPELREDHVPVPATGGEGLASVSDETLRVDVRDLALQVRLFAGADFAGRAPSAAAPPRRPGALLATLLEDDGDDEAAPAASTSARNVDDLVELEAAGASFSASVARSGGARYDGGLGDVTVVESISRGDRKLRPAVRHWRSDGRHQRDGRRAASGRGARRRGPAREAAGAAPAVPARRRLGGDQLRAFVAGASAVRPVAEVGERCGRPRRRRADGAKLRALRGSAGRAGAVVACESARGARRLVARLSFALDEAAGVLDAGAARAPRSRAGSPARRRDREALRASTRRRGATGAGGSRTRATPSRGVAGAARARRDAPAVAGTVAKAAPVALLRLLAGKSRGVAILLVGLEAEIDADDAALPLSQRALPLAPLC
ncbi:hypothetical protein JL720_9960 [Aureococcus anophagefferens]|nr:hypothetical protein JL720_9960 [Aureococcus anophagefferens]